MLLVLYCSEGQVIPPITTWMRKWISKVKVYTFIVCNEGRIIPLNITWLQSVSKNAFHYYESCNIFTLFDATLTLFLQSQTLTIMSC